MRPPLPLPINPYAPIMRCSQSDVSVDNVLQIHGFDLQATLTSQALERVEQISSKTTRTKHDQSVSSVSLNQGAARHLRKGIQQGALDLHLVRTWLSDLLHERGADIYRMKGVLNIAHAEERFVYHAVHEIFTDAFEEAWAEDEDEGSML